MKNVLICTVGTSLLSRTEWKDESGNCRFRSNAIAFARELHKTAPDHPCCGAEINSNNSIIETQRLDSPDKLCLCLSETEEGLLVGEVLRNYYKRLFKQVDAKQIEGMQGKDFKAFKDRGLRNLVKHIAGIVQTEKRKGNDLLINATGGFKAQISFAGLIGQTLHVPVYYMFETFPQVIEMPPMPVDFDFHLWLESYEDLEFLSLEEMIPRGDMDVSKLDRRLQDLIDYDEECLWMSPVLELFHAGFKEKFARREKELLPPPSGIDPESKKINLVGDHHRPRGLQEHMERIARVEFVTGDIRTTRIQGRLPLRNSFATCSRGAVNQIEGSYSDGRLAVRFTLNTTAESRAQQKAAIIFLNRKIART